MSAHDAKYFRPSRRAQANPAREPISAPTFPRQATEPWRVGQLPWPRNLFGALASIAELMAESECDVGVFSRSAQDERKDEAHR